MLYQWRSTNFNQLVDMKKYFVIDSICPTFQRRTLSGMKMLTKDEKVYAFDERFMNLSSHEEENRAIMRKYYFVLPDIEKVRFEFSFVNLCKYASNITFDS